MDRVAVRARFDREVRARPASEPGSVIEHDPYVVRSVGRTNCILYSSLTTATADAAIAAQQARYASAGGPVEWKVYAHDPPPDLAGRLAAAGFAAEPPETLVVRSLRERSAPGPLPADVELRRVSSDAEFGDAVAATREAFGLTDEPRLQELAGRLAEPSWALFVAYADGRPVGAARVEVPDGGAFAGLWGGGIVAAYRHRGIYRALVEVRLDFARSRGAEFATVDAAPTSRPILERIGFEPLDSVQGWTWTPP